MDIKTENEDFFLNLDTVKSEYVIQEVQQNPPIKLEDQEAQEESIDMQNTVRPTRSHFRSRSQRRSRSVLRSSRSRSRRRISNSDLYNLILRVEKKRVKDHRELLGKVSQLLAFHQLPSDFLAKLPVRSFDELEEFHKTLKENPSAARNFEEFASRCMLKDILADEFLPEFNLRGVCNKVSLEAQFFFKIMLAQSRLLEKDFRINIREQIKATHNRLNSEAYRSRKKATNGNTTTEASSSNANEAEDRATEFN